MTSRPGLLGTTWATRGDVSMSAWYQRSLRADRRTRPNSSRRHCFDTLENKCVAMWQRADPAGLSPGSPPLDREQGTLNIDAGTFVLVHLASAHRDAAPGGAPRGRSIWANPAFRSERGFVLPRNRGGVVGP